MIVTVFGLFPITVQTIRGLEAVPQFYSDVALTCGATKAWTLWHVKLRVAARQIYGGIRVSAAYIFATAATAERAEAKQAQAGDARREAHGAIADILGRHRTNVELI